MSYDNIRILHGYEVRIENSIENAVPMVTVCITRLCRVMQNSDPKRHNFYPHRTLMFNSYLFEQCPCIMTLTQDIF